jgi:DNA-binding NarL/FixJ family response regulator
LIRLVLIDDHPIVLDGLQQLFQSEPDIQVVARCVSGAEGLSAIRRLNPEIVVLDLNMPRMSGLEVLRAMRQSQVPARVVLLAATLDEQDVLEATRLGVRGMVLKELAPKMLVQCVRRIHAGGQWVEKEALSRAFETLLRRETGTREVATLLTERELELVKLVGTGLRNRDIGQRLGITEGTVKIHLHKVYQKLQVGSRVELALLVKAKGLT